ncbi:MAG: hypothetical protein NTW20_09905 [Rhodobacterales bacterium]|nr:hypothetical protein [Rhodobacterales bacterium]
MTTSPRLLTRSFLVGVLIVSTSYGASALTVKRTNVMIDGAYVPVLVVKDNGKTHIHRIGDDGLTRSILFDREKSLEWARAKYGADATAATGDDGLSGGGGNANANDDDGGYDNGCP